MKTIGDDFIRRSIRVEQNRTSFLKKGLTNIWEVSSSQQEPEFTKKLKSIKIIPEVHFISRTSNTSPA